MEIIQNKIMFLFLFLFIFSVLTFENFEADALTKASGVGTSKYGSETAGIVCGDRLCSEISDKDEFSYYSSDPLPSWNEGDSKHAIIEFVNKVTSPSLSSYVSPEDRIATFDNDGTLWIEQPLYIPFEFHLEYLYEQLESDPSLSTVHPYSELLEKQDSIVNEDLEEIDGLSDILLPAYPGISQKEYLEKAEYFMDNTKHPRFNVLLKDLTYLPMVELVQYLQDNELYC